MAAAITATGSIMIRPGSLEARYQAIPEKSRASVTRSLTESKKAPLTEVVPEALATGPSSRSGMPLSTRKTKPRVM